MRSQLAFAGGEMQLDAATVNPDVKSTRDKLRAIVDDYRGW
jgi:hypothetical protein